jgi:hypothetical protein
MKPTVAIYMTILVAALIVAGSKKTLADSYTFPPSKPCVELIELSCSANWSQLLDFGGNGFSVDLNSIHAAAPPFISAVFKQDFKDGLSAPKGMVKSIKMEIFHNCKENTFRMKSQDWVYANGERIVLEEPINPEFAWLDDGGRQTVLQTTLSYLCHRDKWDKKPKTN